MLGIAMSRDWVSRVAQNVFSRSVEQKSLRKALKEWKDTAEIIDFSENDDNEKVEEYPNCELCNHPHIRTGYVIRNIYTGHTLTIGCECIKKFQPEFDESTAHQKHVIYCLEQLMAKQSRVNVLGLINYYNEEKAFTPNQLVMVIKLLKQYGIPYTASCFKMKIRRDREKIQFKNLTDSKIILIKNCLSPLQRKKL